jgi:hypothetical protein
MQRNQSVMEWLRNRQTVLDYTPGEMVMLFQVKPNSRIMQAFAETLIVRN